MGLAKVCSGHWGLHDKAARIPGMVATGAAELAAWNTWLLLEIRVVVLVVLFPVEVSLFFPSAVHFARACLGSVKAALGRIGRRPSTSYSMIVCACVRKDVHLQLFSGCHDESKSVNAPRYFWFMVFFVIGVTVVGQDGMHDKPTAATIVQD